MKREPWTKFEKATAHRIDPKMMPLLKECGFYFGMMNDETWVNSRYQVGKRNHSDQLTVLSIKRQDRLPIHDWRELQRIKNELCGPEWMGVEVYPPESELIDTANQFWMWCFAPGAMEWPFMFHGQRCVSEDETGGVRQRRWDSDNRPSDLKTLDEIVESYEAAKKEEDNG